jgi:uncharacterized protein YuzE
MGRTTTKLDTPRIDFSTIDRVKMFHPVYHDDEDVLFLRPDTPRPATSFDLEGEIWIRFDPETGEIVGLEIDDFQAIFLKKHPELAQAWAEAKSSCRRKTKKKGTDMTWDSFLLIMLNFLLTFLRENPQQAEWDIVPMRAG